MTEKVQTVIISACVGMLILNCFLLVSCGVHTVLTYFLPLP